MDAAHSEKAALYGVSEGGPMALLFTAPIRPDAGSRSLWKLCLSSVDTLGR